MIRIVVDVDNDAEFYAEAMTALTVNNPVEFMGRHFMALAIETNNGSCGSIHHTLTLVDYYRKPKRRSVSGSRK